VPAEALPAPPALPLVHDGVVAPAELPMKKLLFVLRLYRAWEVIPVIRRTSAP
jgi:hypothetical protein